MFSQETVERLIEKTSRLIGWCGSGDQQSMITLELLKGNVSLLSIPQTSNIFNTSKYTIWNFFPYTLYASLTRLQNIFYLALSLIMLIRPYELTPFYRWVIIFPLGFNILIYMLKEYMLNRNRWTQDHQINNQMTRRGVRDSKHADEHLEDVKWSDLLIGDVVYLTKGEVVPADIILLDSGHVKEREALCMVDTQYTDGTSTLTKKRSSYLTQLIVTRTRQKNNFKEYRKMLTGKLEYELPNSDTHRFKGKLKLKKDPKIDELTIDNFIPKGSKVRQTSWLFGLVVYTGMDTKMMMCSRYSTSKTDYYNRISNLLTFLFLLMIAFFALISIIVLLSRSDDLGFIRKYDSNATSGLKIFNLLVLYSQILPFGLFLLQDLIQLFCKYMIEHEMISAYGTQFTKVNDSTSLSDLGQAEFMLIDKTGTLTTSYQKIDSVLFGSHKYVVNHDTMFEQLMNPQKNGGTIEQDYQVNLEHELGEANGLVQDARVMERSVKGVVRIAQPKKNEMVFSQGSRKPVPPTYVTYDQVLNQPHNLSLSDLKIALEAEVDQNHHSQLNSNHNHNHELKQQISMRRSVYNKKNVNTSQELKDQSSEFAQLVNSYQNETPQDHFQRTRDENDLLYDSFMKCMLLCHEARPVYLANKDTTYESFSKNEEVALQFAQLCGYSLEKFNRFESPDEYFCRIGKEIVKYKVLGLNQFTYGRKLNSVVVQCPQSSEIRIPDHRDYAGLQQLSGVGSNNSSILISKGDYEAMKDLLDINHKEREELETMLAHYKRRGVRMILYATRELTEENTQEYSREFNVLKSSLTSQESQLEKLAKEYEKNLNILGIIGFKEELKPDAIEFIDSMRASNINCWLMSGDQAASTISCACALGLIDALQTKVLHITRKSSENVLFEINSALGQVESEMAKHPSQTTSSSKNIIGKPRTIQSSTTIFADDNFNKMNLFTLCVNGHSLKTIQHHPQLISHFRFLCCICRTVIGYNMSPQQKQFMCAMVKNYFPSKPTVVAVGDGFNDALMMQEADVGIEVLNKGSKGKVFKPQVNAGDILVSSLSQIKDLVLTHGKQQSERTANVIYFLFYESLFLGMTLFYFNWFCLFTATSMHDSMTIFLTNFFFLVPNALILGLVDEPTYRAVNHYLPALYADGQVRKKYFLVFFLFHSFIEGFVQAACVFYSTVFLIQFSTNLDGHTGDLQMMSTIIIYSILIACTFKLFFVLLSRGVKSALGSQFLTLGFVVVFIIVNLRGNFSAWDYMALTYEIFTRFDSVMSLLFNLIVCLLISFVVNEVRVLLVPTLYEQFGSQNTEGVAWEEMKNSEVFSQCVSKQMQAAHPNHQRRLGDRQEGLHGRDGDLAVHPRILFLTVPKEQNHIYENFLNITREKNSLSGKYKIVGLWFNYLILTLLLIIVRKLLSHPNVVFLMRAIYLGVQLIIFAMLDRSFASLSINMAYWATLLYAGITTLVQAYYTEDQNITTISILELLFIMLIACNTRMFGFLGTMMYLLCTFACFLGLYIQSDQISLYYVFYVFGAVVLTGITSHQSLRESIEIFNNLQINEERKVKQLALVSQLLPTHAFLKLRNSSIYNKQDLTDEFHEVTLLFADIKGFTEYSNACEKPEDVVLMLRNLFTEFDKKCQFFNVYKVYTIGDCYVVMGFTNSAKRNPIQEAINTINMGFAMIDIIRDVRIKINFSKLDMRIGIHTGYVIGGIIGTDIVRYDLYGKDVSIANKMESNGVEGRIMVSDTTKSMVDRLSDKSPFLFEHIKEVDLPKFNVCYQGYLVEKNPQFKDQEEEVSIKKIH